MSQPGSGVGPIYVYFAGWLWLAFGLLQVIATALEFIAASFAGLFIIVASDRFREGAGAGLVIVFILAGYVLFRLSIAAAFVKAGITTVFLQEPKFSNAVASLGIGLILSYPVYLALVGRWETISLGPNTAPVGDFPGILVPIGFALNSLILITAGAMAIYDHVRFGNDL